MSLPAIQLTTEVIMKNPATNQPRCNELNCLTYAMYEEIKAGRTPVVRLRDGRLVELYWFDGDGPEYEGFASNTGGSFRWNHDGTSITSNDFDIMELDYYVTKS